MSFNKFTKWYKERRGLVETFPRKTSLVRSVPGRGGLTDSWIMICLPAVNWQVIGKRLARRLDEFKGVRLFSGTKVAGYTGMRFKASTNSDK